MKTASAALTTLLNAAGGATPLIQFDLYTFNLTSGLQLRYTTADFAIIATDNTIWGAPAVNGGSNLWFAGISWSPFGIDDPDGKALGHWKVGLDSDSWQVTVNPRPLDLATGAAFPDTIGSVPWLQAVSSGMLDNADVIVSRAYFSAMPTHPIALAGVAPVGTILIFRGIVGEVDCTTSAAYLTFNDYKSLLTQQMPRNVYQASCRYRLFDARCTLSAAAYTQTGAAGAGSTRSTINATVSAPGGTGTFTLGTLTMTSGLNNGFSRLVSIWSSSAGTFTLLNPFPFTIAPGDTFSVTAGCGKHLADCTAFGNKPNFPAQPFIPAPEVAL